MNVANDAVPVLESIAPLAARYDAWLCDVWGVMHNGERPFMDAANACIRFREGGGRVVLISNSPRPCGPVAQQLADVGVPAESYDAIMTSGDTTRHELAARKVEPVFHLGPPRDKPLLEGLDLNLTDFDKASYVLCSGLYDDLTEVPDDYAEMLSQMKQRHMLMVCANPDIQVERGNRLIYCAGALAAAYEELGGKVIYAGKPHRPIYDAAIARIRELTGVEIPLERILCIGDGLKTDMAGAAAAGMDALFIASGLHIESTDNNGPLVSAEVAALFSGTAVKPIAAQKSLKW